MNLSLAGGVTLIVVAVVGALYVAHLNPADGLGGGLTIAFMLGAPGVYLLTAGLKQRRYDRIPAAKRAAMAATAAEAQTKRVAVETAAAQRTATHICERCGHLGNPVESKRGDGCLEVLLWCLAILPGLIYSIWRANSKRLVCSSCGADALVPRNSPRGKVLEAKYGEPQAGKALDA